MIGKRQSSYSYREGLFPSNRQCLLLALSRRAQCADECPLLGGEADIDQPLFTKLDMSTRPSWPSCLSPNWVTSSASVRAVNTLEFNALFQPGTKPLAEFLPEVRGTMRFKIRGVGMMDALKSSLSVLALLCFCLVSWTAAAQEAVQLTFQTLDGDTQQVNSEEIWRIRATSTSDEPPGAIVIDYAFERVYVKESLASVVEKVGGVRPLKKFTLPAGAPVYIVATKVTGVTRAIPHAASPECPCDHRLARRPDPGSGNARSHQRNVGEIVFVEAKLDGRCADILLQAMGLRSAWDRDDPRFIELQSIGV